jgi:hypothetical protein
MDAQYVAAIGHSEAMSVGVVTVAPHAVSSRTASITTEESE